MSDVKKILIIGGVATGPKAASRARRCDPDAEITIVEQGDYISYAGCGLPYSISGIIKESHDLMSTGAGILRDASYFKNTKNINVFIGTRAEFIDRKNKTVHTTDLSTGKHMKMPYDKLVIATGAITPVPNIKGINLKNIFKLRTPQDAIEIREIVSQGKIKNAVIIGAGFIGLETAEALASHKLNITVIEMLDNVLPRVLDSDMAMLVSNYLMEMGVEIKTNCRVIEFGENNDGAVKTVITEKESIDADIAILTTGVAPNVKLAVDAGLKIGETGAIEVNQFLQTSDPDIYAGGDCVENTNLLNKRKTYLPLGSVANRHGRIIGDNITGGNEIFPGVLGTCIVKILEINVGKTGLNVKEAESSGYDIETILIPQHDKAHYYPGHKLIITKLIVDKKDEKIIGAQIIGPGDVSKRIDIIATAINFEAKLEDLSSIDLSYAPPYSSAIDPLIHAVNAMRNKLSGKTKSINPVSLMDKIKSLDDILLLDVRTPGEFNQAHIEAKNVKLLPLEKLQDEGGDLSKENEIVTYCALGPRSYEAQVFLESKGFKNVKFLEGGIRTWPFDIA